jgi:hypothetical protein
MTVRQLSILLVPAALSVGCAGGGGESHIVVSDSNQGSRTIRYEPNPPDARLRQVAPTTGPTAREIEQQRRIEQLEGQSKALNDEIERLKREKNGR